MEPAGASRPNRPNVVRAAPFRAQERGHAFRRARAESPQAGRGPPRKARPPQGAPDPPNKLEHCGSVARLQTARNASDLEPVGLERINNAVADKQ